MVLFEGVFADNDDEVSMSVSMSTPGISRGAVMVSCLLMQDRDGDGDGDGWREVVK